MPNSRSILIVLLTVLAAFEAGRWTGPPTTAKAYAADSTQVEVREINAQTSLVVYEPSVRKMFVYTPFAGQPTWSCAFSIQLGAPGEKVERQQCTDSR